MTYKLKYPDNCTAFDPKTKKCTVYECRRSFCKEYPWNEWCERELKEKGLWDEYLGEVASALPADVQRISRRPF